MLYNKIAFIVINANSTFACATGSLVAKFKVHLDLLPPIIAHQIMSKNFGKLSALQLNV